MRLTIIFLLFLLFVSQAQRGGGSTSSSSSSSRRSSSWGSTRHRSSTWNRGTSSSSSGEGSILWLLPFGGIFAAFAYFAHKGAQKQAIERAKQLEQKLNNYEGMNEVSCKLTDEQKSTAKDWFARHKWNLRFKTNDNTFNDVATLTMSELKEKSRLSMSLKMKSKDSVGTSQIEGILLYKYDYLAIYFFKSYDDKKNSGQTGPYQWLAYEGVQQGEMFRGSWYYEGFQGSGSYSGVWEMMHN